MSIGAILRSYAPIMVALIGVVSMATILLTPLVTHAALVTCGTNIETYNSSDGKQICTKGECTVCDMQKLAQQVLNFCFIIMIILAALLFVNAGFKYLMAASDPGGVSQAHKIFTNTLIGIVIILCAWLFVDTIIKQLAGNSIGNYGPWNDILCKNSGSEHCVDKLTPIDVNVNQTPGTITNCSDNGGTCQVNASCDGPAVRGTECDKDTVTTPWCCLPKTSQSDCKLSTGSTGSCQTKTACGTSEQGDSASCGNGLVCCAMASQIKKCGSGGYEGYCVNSSAECEDLGTQKMSIISAPNDCSTTDSQRPLCCGKVTTSSAGNGSCKSADDSSQCSVSNLQQYFGSNANAASSICQAESSGQNVPSASDVCNGDKNVPFSFGLFQINIAANSINGLNCPSAFSGYSYNKSTGKYTCTVTNAGLYSQCKNAAMTPSTNIQKAASMSNSGNSWGAWSTAKGCGL